jgi:hypothetical protein
MMRFFKFLALGTLIVGAFGWSSVAKADNAPGDPVVSIRKCVTGCDLGTFDDGNSQQNPIIVADGSGVSNFEYCPELNCSGIAEVFLEVVTAQGESNAQFNKEKFSCIPGEAATCSTVSPTVLPAVEFVFDGPCIQNCDPNSSDPVFAAFLTPGEIVGVSVPEPNGLALLFVGLVSLIGLGLKRKDVTVS